MAQGIPSRIEWRVVNEHTGAEVVGRLSHPHKGEGTVRLLVNGYPSQTSLGTCTIPLHQPGSPQWADALEDYRLLRKGLKLEGYTSDTSGTPRYSYVIDDITKSTTEWTITGVATPSWLTKTHMLPGEILASPITGVLPTSGIEIVNYLQGVFKRQWSDDFSGYGGGTGPHPSTDYTSSGWTFTSADPYESAPALTSTSTTDAYAISTGNWTNLTQFWAGLVTISGTLKPGTAASPSTVGEASVILMGDATWSNGLLVRMYMLYNGVSWDVGVDIYSKAAGVYTSRGSASNVFTAMRSPFPFQVRVPIFMNAGRHTVGIWVNGKDSGLYVTDGGFFPGNLGGVGIRYVTAAGGSPQVWVNRLEFKARTVQGIWGTPRFRNGIQSGFVTHSIPQELTTSGQSQLDMMLMAAATDGFQLRVTPGRGHEGDALDYHPQPGNDLHDSVVLRWKDNVVSASVQSVPESYAEDVRMEAIPASDSGGTVTWSRIGAAGDMALEDQVADVGQPGFRFLTNWAQLVSARKQDPLQAIVLEVVRTPDLADAFREGDIVLADVPLLDVNNEQAMVVEYGWSEIKGTFPVTLNDFPQAARVPASRVTNPLSHITRVVQPR